MSSVACSNCGRPTGDNLVICPKCTGILVKTLRSVPSLVSDMTITQARLDRMSRGRVGGKSADTPLPISIDKHDELPTRKPFDLLDNEITTWTRAFSDHMGHRSDGILAALDAPGLIQLTLNNKTGPRVDTTALSMQPTLYVEQCAIWLACHPVELRRMPAVDEMYDSLTDVIALVNKAIDQLPELKYKGRCGYVQYDQGRESQCNTDLYAESGEEWVRCPRCNASYPVTQLDREILAKMRDMNYTVPELLRLLRELGSTVGKSTLYRWVKERKVRPRGWVRNGRITDTWIHRDDPAVYRLGDVLDLATRAERARA
ncbi:hypothetical protein [Rhodococcoides fascians]|uniref:hypothetical protein n=1 Tax=Rhodococcoides fascians TaxID=1828 RepID=UPI0012D32307|nr:hypothetical protein [Rhodococcus fascians]